MLLKVNIKYTANGKQEHWGFAGAAAQLGECIQSIISNGGTSIEIIPEEEESTTDNEIKRIWQLISTEYAELFEKLKDM